MKNLTLLSFATLFLVLINSSVFSQWQTNNYGIHYNDGKVGIGTGADEPEEKLEVNGNIQIDQGYGLVMTSPSGTKWKLTVDDNGNLSTNQISNIIKPQKNVDVIMYPNPSDDYIRIQIPSQEEKHLSVEIYDFIGKMIFMQEYRGIEFVINISQFNSGTYLLKVKDENRHLVKTDKIIKK